jgi:MscS family membrane protein
MKKFRDVCLVMVLSALFPGAHIQLQSRAQAIPAVHGQPPAAQNEHVAHPEAEAEKPSDPLGRSTPHGTVIGFLQSAQKGNYKEAAQYLQLSKNERRATGEELARRLHALMDNAFLGRVGAITEHREGSIQPGVSQDHEQIGVFRLDDIETPVDLVHVSDSQAGDIWLFSSQTLAQVPNLFDQIESDTLESHLPAFLSTTRILSMPLWRWIAFLLLIPAAFGLTWVTVKVAVSGWRIWLRFRKHPVIQDIHDSLTGPITLILTVLVHRIGTRFLGVPLLFRMYYQRTTDIILVAGAAWLAFRIVGRWEERVRSRALSSPKDRSGAIVLLGQKILNVLIVIIAGLLMLSILGFDLTTAIAGLGIGSIAIAFAAQKTLENLLGGVSIIGDQVVRVGEACRIADRIGTVEDISLRSTRIRTLQRTELSVPNGQLANMNLENLSRRDKFLLETTIGLQQETSPAQLRSFLTNVRELLLADARVGRDNFRVRLIGIGESSFDLEISCLILTSDLGEFFAIREDLLLHILDLMAAKGIGLAVPVRNLHLTRDQNLDYQNLDQQDFRQRRTA